VLRLGLRFAKVLSNDHCGQVSQTEQASVQAAKNLVAALSSMYAPLYFTNHYFNTDWTGWKVISFAFFGYALTAVATIIFFLAYLMVKRLPPFAQTFAKTPGS